MEVLWSPVEHWVFLVLCFCSFLGSLMSASMGVGGGAFLIMMLAEFLSPLVLIPIHGIVQMASNASRCWLTRQYVDESLLVWFFAGALVASVIGAQGIRWLPEDLITWAVAAFILYSCWGPMPNVGLSESRIGRIMGGFVTTLATLFAGATGPLVSAWLRTDHQDRFYYTANFSSCMTMQHGLKILVFSLAGFNFAEWAGLILMMIVCGYFGTRVGLKLLGKMPEKVFKKYFRYLLTFLALKLIWSLSVNQ